MERINVVIWVILIIGLLGGYRVMGSEEITVVQKQIDIITGSMVIEFSRPTNQAGFAGPLPCYEILTVLAEVTDFEYHLCSFSDKKLLYIFAPPTSNWSNATPFTFNMPSPITADDDPEIIFDDTNVHYFDFYESRSFDPPQIVGPSHFSTNCGSGLYFQIEADYSAGRRWQSVTFQTPTPAPTPVFYPDPPKVDRGTLGFYLPAWMIPANTSVFIFKVTAMNFFGVWAESPDFFRIDLGDNLRLPTTIRGGGRTRVHKANEEIRLSAITQVEKQCVPDLTQPLSFYWEILAVSTDTPTAPASPIPTSSLVMNRSELVIPPGFLRPKDNSRNNYYKVQLKINSTEIPGLLGEAFVFLDIRHSDPVISLIAPSWIPKTADLVLDARRSCDPDYVPDCQPLVGLTNLSTNNKMSVDFELYKKNGEQFDPFEEYESFSDDGFWNVGRPGKGVYRLTARFHREMFNDDPINVYRIITIGEPGVGESPNCVTPRISLPFFPTPSYDPENVVVPVAQGVPFVLRATNVEPTAELTWFVESEPTQPSAFPVAFTPFRDRPALSVSSHLLFPGYTYTFTLRANANCGGGVATGQVSIKVNTPPFGGMIGIYPDSGRAFEDLFFIHTGGWSTMDPDVQLPLKYEFQYLRGGTRSPVTLASEASTGYILARLAGPKSNCRDPSMEESGQLAERNTIIVVCRDALGSTATARTSAFQVWPLFNESIDVPDLTEGFKPLDVAEQIQKVGANLEDQLRTLAMLAEEASATECSGLQRGFVDQVALTNYRRDVLRQSLYIVDNARVGFREFGRPPSLSQLNLLVGALAASLGGGAFSALGQLEITLGSRLITDIIQDAQDLTSSLPVDVPISLAFAPSLLDALSGISRSLKYVRDQLNGVNPLEGIPGADIRDILTPIAMRGQTTTTEEVETTCGWECNVAKGLQRAMRNLVGVILTNFEPGSEPKTVFGLDVEIKLSRELRERIGNDIGVRQMEFEDGPKFYLPPNLLTDPSKIRNGTNLSELPRTIDICAIRYKFNPLELNEEANDPPGVNRDQGPRGITVPGVLSPNFTIQEVHTLLFLNQENVFENLDPYNLTEKINITIPLPGDYELPDMNGTEELVCGFWDASFGGWSVEGCSVLDVDLDNRYVLCSCNHASDFAAWNAFLANLGGGDIGVVANIAIIVVALLMPGLLLVWLLAFLWARNKDEEDSHAVHLGALVLLTKNRLRLHQQQRRFFQALRENARRPAGQESATKRRANLNWALDDSASSLGKPTTNNSADDDDDSPASGCCHRASVFGAWFRALYYEHSFFGIFTRFDPFYTRTQRVTVFTCVLVGNLFAASFFFDFKTADDLSAGVLIASIIAAALVVAIPVKVSIRWLFRSTEFHLGSPMHRVAQIYRISEFQSGDLLPVYASEAERADSYMLFAFKDFYAAKSNVVALQVLLHEFDQAEATQPSASSWWRCCRRCRSAGRNWCKTELQRTVDVEERRRTMISRLGLLKVDENGDVDRVEVEKMLDKAQSHADEMLKTLTAACKRSSEEWSKVPKLPNVRVETMRKQQSTLLKFASLLYEETETRAKPRPKILSAWFIYVAWGIVLIYLLGGIAYCTRWVLGRTSYRGVIDPDSSHDQLETDANGVIVAWLLSAAIGVGIGVFLSEPVIQFIRFSAMPFILRRFGNGTMSLWSRRRSKVAISPPPPSGSSDDDDKDGPEKLVVGKPIPTVRTPTATTSPTSSFNTTQQQQSTSGGVDNSHEREKAGQMETQVSEGAKKGSLMQQFKQKKKKQRNEQAGNPILESLADLVEAIA